MSIEVMKQALDALEEYQAKGPPFMSCDAAVAALRAAIEQAEKPVAWRWKEVKGEFVGDWMLTEIEPPPYVTESMPLYAAPRQWVGLTDEEIYQIGLDTPIGATNFARAIEAKLKEKNDVLRSV